jgi:hypothetical protein
MPKSRPNSFAQARELSSRSTPVASTRAAGALRQLDRPRGPTPPAPACWIRHRRARLQAGPNSKETVVGGAERESARKRRSRWPRASREIAKRGSGAGTAHALCVREPCIITATTRFADAAIGSRPAAPTSRITPAALVADDVRHLGHWPAARGIADGQVDAARDR